MVFCEDLVVRKDAFKCLITLLILKSNNDKIASVPVVYICIMN